MELIHKVTAPTEISLPCAVVPEPTSEPARDCHSVYVCICLASNQSAAPLSIDVLLHNINSYEIEFHGQQSLSVS